MDNHKDNHKDNKPKLNKAKKEELSRLDNFKRKAIERDFDIKKISYV